jgi:hypothetical protein
MIKFIFKMINIPIYVLLLWEQLIIAHYDNNINELWENFNNTIIQELWINMLQDCEECLISISIKIFEFLYIKI